MTAPEPRAGLTEAERESLLACDCGHDIGGEHNGLGCYAIDWGQTEKGHDVRCRCPETDDRESVNFATAERILAARLAARDAEWASKVEALADAVEWCRTDLIYKAPEQYTAVAPSHLAGIAGRLRALLADMQEGHDG